MVFSQAKHRAKKSGMDFCIEHEDIDLPTHCPALGTKLDYLRQNEVYTLETSPSLDRVNNNLGYVKGNVRVISLKANLLKKNGTLEEFKGIVRYLEGESLSQL